MFDKIRNRRKTEEPKEPRTHEETVEANREVAIGLVTRIMDATAEHGPAAGYRILNDWVDNIGRNPMFEDFGQMAVEAGGFMAKGYADMGGVVLTSVNRAFDSMLEKEEG